MFYNTGVTRPNRLEDKKDRDYHVQYAKFCMSTMGDYLYRRFINKALVNWSFFKGGDGQWIFEEDTEAFFLDESGDIRNRLKWTKNVLKPMVQQYVGNAIRLSYDAKAQCISDFVINKRDEELAKIKFMHQAADKNPVLGKIIRDRVPLGDTEIESEEIFINSFNEEFTDDINNLVEFLSKEVQIDELKVQISRNLALNGLGIYKGYEEGGLYRGKATNPLFFWWDMSATLPDLSDSEFMGEWYYMDAPSIFERAQNLTNIQRAAIESFSRQESAGIHKIINNIRVVTGGKIPVYEAYWKDVETQEYGYVLDEFGYPYYTHINHKDCEYTDKDLIEPISEKHKEEMGESKKHRIYVDIMRYCIFIPKEEIGSADGDIVLEYGIAPYQEKYLYDPANVKFPYKCYTWVYDRGEILTPLDDAIDPQRFLNRTMSVVEGHLANMRGTGTVISKSAVDDRDGEAEVNRNINASKAIFVDTDRVGSVQNAIGTYGTNIGAGTLQLFQVIDTVKASIQDVTGVNDSMTGTGGASDQLVGVVDAQIQRGSLVQEPFYWGLTSVLRQAYDHMATVGKAIAYDNPRRLAIMVGDKGAKNLVITKDHMLLDNRISINRSETKEQGIQNGNALLFTLLQGGLIEKEQFQNLFNRADADRISKALRAFAKEELQAKIETDKATAAQNQQNVQDQNDAVQATAMEAKRQEQLAFDDGRVQHEDNMELASLKETAKLEREKLKVAESSGIE